MTYLRAIRQPRLRWIVTAAGKVDRTRLARWVDGSGQL